MIMVACGYPACVLTGRRTGASGAAFVDAETGVEIAAADMPGEGLTISRNIWSDALAAAGV